METEGNVAVALTELMENCAGGQRRLMVEVLRSNPGTIHSFAEFRDKLGCPVPKLTPVFVVSMTFKTAPPPSPPTVNASIAKKEVGAASKAIRGLNKKLGVAVKKADDPPACVKEPCKAALKTLTRPAVIEYEITLAKIQKGAADDYDSAKEQSKAAGLGIQELLKRDSKQEARDRRKVVHAAVVGLEEVLKAARPVFKEDSSKFTRGFRKLITKAAAKFRRAEKKAAKTLPGPLVLLPQAPSPPRKAPRIPEPPQTPFPGPTFQPRAATTLTTTECPFSAITPKPIEVGGSLTPAQADSAVSVTFSRPGSSPVTVVVKTDAAGDWKASHTPGPNETGVWDVNAGFAGDSKRLPSSSPLCQVDYQ
jgi:hypothetical protein